MGVFKKLWNSVKAVGKAIWGGVSGIIGLIFGSILGWIFLGILWLINISKKRIKLSPCLQEVLSTYFSSINLSEVRIIVHANGIPFGKTALTEGYDIYWKHGFSEDKPGDLKQLLHELVHVKQYNEYDKEGFYIIYAFGYMNGGFSYSDIPMEKEADDYANQIYNGFLSNFKTQCNPNIVTEEDLSDWAWLLM